MLPFTLNFLFTLLDYSFNLHFGAFVVVFNPKPFITNSFRVLIPWKPFCKTY